jgi:hypothetical protein
MRGLVVDDFGAYECLEQVGHGSTGTVWRARHRELDRIVAVKELSPALRHRPGFLDGFRAEASHLAALHDPHVVRVFDYVEEPDRAWMAEEWVDGVRLDALRHSVGRFTAEQALGVMRGVLLGLAAAHAARLVHGDVAPRNILVASDGTAKLVDFGLAAPAGSPADPELLGTPAYLAPETILRHARDLRSDVYSAAAVLVELVTGTPPYGGGSLSSVLDRHVSAPVPELADLGTPLAGLLRRALAKDPDERPVDAGAFLAELEDAAREEHGPGWLERSSLAVPAATLLAGAVGATMGGAAMAMGMAAGAGGTTAVAGSAGAGAAAVVTAGTATTGASATSASTIAADVTGAAARSASRKLLYLAGGGTAAAGALAVAALVLTSGAKPVSIAGTYRFEGHVISTEFTNGKVGRVLDPVTMTLPACAKTPCSGTLTTSNGDKRPFTFDGSVLRVVRTADASEPCGTHGDARESTTLDLTLRPDRTTGKAQRFSGQLAQTTVALAVPRGCVIGPPKHETSAITLTRVG